MVLKKDVANEVKQKVAAVLADVKKEYLQYRNQVEVNDNVLNCILLPSLILLPVYANTEDNSTKLQDAGQLAFVLHMTNMAQHIHNILPRHGDRDVYQRPILVGDYFFSKAFGFLLTSGHMRWLEDICNSLARINVVRANRLRAGKRVFLPEEQRSEFLQSEHSELAVIAAQIGASLAAWDNEKTENYAGLAYYLGVLSGMEKEDFYWRYEETMDMVYLYIQSLPQYLKELLQSVLGSMLAGGERHIQKKKIVGLEV